MIVVGLIMSDMPPFTGKWFRICIYLNTKWIRNSLGIFLNGKLCHIEPILYFSTAICLLILGICSFELARFNRGLPGITCIHAWSGANSPSACRVVNIKPHLMQYKYISLKALKIVLDFLSVRRITAVKIILRLIELNFVFHLQRIYLLS